MKVIILAGGHGTRISEETMDKPKPMVLINKKPLLWHVMNLYSIQGFKDFIIATGYKGEVIKDWVSNLDEDWNVKTLDTGLHTQTGGRLKYCIEYCKENSYLATYGDGVGNINIKDLIKVHAESKSLVTLTAVRPPARFGYVDLKDKKVENFGEKNQSNEGWINGGFFLIDSEVANLISGPNDIFEIDTLPYLAKKGKLYAHKHESFWQPMDTLREKMELEKFSQLNPPPWISGL